MMSEQWPVKLLGEVCKLRNGRAYKKTELLDEGKYRVLRVGNFFTNKHWYYSDLELDDTKFCETGDLLYAWSASFGPRIWEGEKSIFHYHIWRVDYDKNILNKKYLYYWFLWDAEKIKSEQGTGTTMIHVSMKSMNSREISIPPLNEQQRIVKIIDDSFVKINQNITKLQSKFDLITDIYSSQIKSIFSNADERWVKSTLGELSNVKSGGTPLRSREDYWGGNIPWFSSGELNNIFTTKPNRYITNLGLEKSNAKIFPKDSLLIGMYDTAALKMSIMDREGTFNQAIAGVKPNPDLDMRFLLHAINNVKKEVRAQRRGTRQKNLNLTKIKNIELLIPPIKIQVKIADKLDSLIDSVQKIESIFSEQLECRKELKQSLLQEAFNGNLTMEITA